MPSGNRLARAETFRSRRAAPIMSRAGFAVQERIECQEAEILEFRHDDKTRAEAIKHCISRFFLKRSD
jgi:hypothetical protein